MSGNGDYISREAANEACREAVRRYPNSFYNGIEAARDAIRKLPAADVRPVVLCRDCKYSDTFAPDCTDTTFPLKCLSIRYGGVYPNWFCEHGEKRDETVAGDNSQK